MTELIQHQFSNFANYTHGTEVMYVGNRYSVNQWRASGTNVYRSTSPHSYFRQKT